MGALDRLGGLGKLDGLERPEELSKRIGESVFVDKPLCDKPF